MTLKFLEKFKKEVAKLDTVSVGIKSTEVWLSTGNYALNRALSGDFTRGIPLSRLSGFMGPSGCLPADEVINVYVFKSQTSAHPEIKKE